MLKAVDCFGKKEEAMWRDIINTCIIWPLGTGPEPPAAAVSHNMIRIIIIRNNAQRLLWLLETVVVVYTYNVTYNVIHCRSCVI